MEPQITQISQIHSSEICEICVICGSDVYKRQAKVHVSGHASREEMKLLINLIKPVFLIPIHGELRHLKLHAQIGQTLGIPAERIAVVENGTPIDLTPYSMTVRDRLPGGYV